MAKITFIGAGSVVFAKNLICDILQNPSLEASTICLMDIDPSRLKIAEILARKVVAQLGVRARVEATLDLQTACTGAKFVITMIQVGGYKPATVTDFEIPKKYGLRQTIADTLGVGGIFRALRTMPELVKVGHALRDHGAPDPLFLNYSNPMAMNMMAIDRMCGIPSVGLCHSVQGTSHQLAGYAGLPYEDITYKVAGINHVAFFLEFKYRGQDAYPLLFDALENPRIFASDKVRFEMMRRLGYFVTESSEHFSEYCPWFLHHGAKVIDDFGIPLDEYLRRCESIIATWKDTEKRMLADSQVSIGKSVEYGSRIINAIESGQPEVIYGNVPNHGLITNLPAGCSVEVPCLVDRQGVQPTVIGDLPPQLAAMCRTNIAVQELAVEAFLTGKREHIYHAVMMDPHTSSQLTLDNIWKMCDELIAAHQRDGFLPEFAPVRNNTGRTAATLARVMVSIEEKSAEVVPSSVTRLELIVDNRLGTRYRGTLTLETNDADLSLSRNPRVTCDVPAGTIKKIPFTVRRLRKEAPLAIGITADSSQVLARSFQQPLRNVVRSEEGIGVDWSGNRVAEGRLSLEKKRLKLSLRITDTDIQVNSDAFWDGSAVELFFAMPGAPEEISQLVCLPDVKSPRVIFARGGQEVRGAKAAIRADKGGYSLDLSIPLLAAGITSGKPFLMEMQVRVNALGDAHGRVSATWQGSPQAQQESSHFAWVRD